MQLSDFKPGDAWKRRDGKKAIILATDGSPKDPVIAYCPGDEAFELNSNGSFWNNTPHDLDLIEPWREPIKVQGWVNVYPGESAGCIWGSKQEADDEAGEDRIACVYVEGEEGVEP